MKIPKGMTEESVLAVINNIASKLASKFRFGYYDTDDIKQEAIIIAIEGLERFDDTKPLENFLFVHVRNRLITFKRDNYIRKNYICKICNNKDPECENCYKRKLNQTNKQFLLEPLDIYSINDENESRMKNEDEAFNSITIDEYTNLINKHLPLSLRMDYLKMKSGIYISKQRKTEIETTITKILQEQADENW